MYDVLRSLLQTAYNPKSGKLKGKIQTSVYCSRYEGEISNNSIMTVNLKGELPRGMKETMTRKDRSVFKVCAVEGRKHEAIGGRL